MHYVYIRNGSGDAAPRAVHMLVQSNRSNAGELLCAVGALFFVATGCWMGWAVAVNGVLAHGTQVWFTHAANIVVFDIACNIAFTIIMAADGVLWPISLAAVAVVLVGLVAAHVLSEEFPFGARVVHVLAVQLPSFWAIYTWCHCCSA